MTTYTTEKTPIGSGAFSYVYKGYNKNNASIPLAVKVLNLKGLLQKYGEQYRKYLQREIDTMKTLRNHPNIVCLDEVEYAGDFVYIGMEYCESDLKKYLNGNNRERLLSEEEAQNFMRQIANGLKFMGGQAIAHRDLKPQNILIATNGPNITLKIADFGFARIMAKDSMNMNASHCGTPLYMAPEVNKQVYSDTCDLWSLGVILFEMMFGFNKLKNCSHFILAGGISQLLPKTLSNNCIKLFEDLLQTDPAKRIPWLDFFNHPFLYEPHPEVSLLKLAEPNAVQVFSFPSLEAYSLVLLDADSTVLQWKLASGLDENSVAILCRDTDNNRFDEQSKWCGIELKDLEPIGVYQIGALSTANQCIFIFDNRETASVKFLLDTNLRDVPKIEKPDERDRDLYLKRCRDAVAVLYEDVSYVYEKCSNYVLTRELLRYGNRAIRAASKTRREDLEVEYQRLGDLLEPSEAEWKRILSSFTESLSTIEMFPGIPFPAFLRPTRKSVDELISEKKREFEEIKTQQAKINTAFGRAKAAMNGWRPASLLNFIEDKYKEMLNGQIYEFKRNVSHFLSMLESPNNAPQGEMIGDGKEVPHEIIKARVLLEYSMDLNERVRVFHKRLVATLQDADELIDQTKKAVDHHRLLTRLKGDAITEKAFSPDSVPSLTREALTFANSVKPLLNFVELPSIVNRFLRLLHDRQKYEKQMQKIKYKSDSVLNNMYSRHHEQLEKFYNGHQLQLGALFPGFTQISPLPVPSLTLTPLPSLEGYPDIPPSSFASIQSPKKEDPVFDLEDEFSMIVKEETTISSVLHDNAQLALKLREAQEDFENAKTQVKHAQEVAGVGAGELTRRVMLYERMASLKNSTGTPNLENENRVLAEQLRKTTEELVKLQFEPSKTSQRDPDYEFELRARLRTEWEAETIASEIRRQKEKEAAEDMMQAMNHTIDQQSREIEEQKTIMAVEIAKIEEERGRVEEERSALQQEKKQLEEHAHTLTQEAQEMRVQLERTRDQLARESEAARANNANAQEAQQEARKQLESANAEVTSLRAQIAAAQEAQNLAQERIAALVAQHTELRDEVMAYKIAYAMDYQQEAQPAQPLAQAPPANP